MAQETVICAYRVRPPGESDFARSLGRPWLTLHALGFGTDEQPLVLRGREFPHFQRAALPA